MTPDEIVRALRINQNARLTLSEIARRAGLDRQTLYNAMQSGYLSERSRSALSSVLQAAEREGYQIARASGH
jgi:DNA-binding phage protein